MGFLSLHIHLYAQYFVLIKKGKIVNFEKDFDDHKISKHKIKLISLKYFEECFCRKKALLKRLKTIENHLNQERPSLESNYLRKVILKKWSWVLIELSRLQHELNTSIVARLKVKLALRRSELVLLDRQKDVFWICGFEPTQKQSEPIFLEEQKAKFFRFEVRWANSEDSGANLKINQADSRSFQADLSASDRHNN